MLGDLPVHVLVSILSKLSVKDVIRFQLVQKSLYSVINSKEFVDLHNGVPKISELILIIFKHESQEMRVCLRYDDAALTEYMPLRFPFEFSIHSKVSGCCNGLVCLSGYGRFRLKPILWNPLIQKSLILPHSLIERSMFFLGLGFDDESKDYKVLKVYKKHDKAELYSLKDNSWKIIANPAPRVKWLSARDVEVQPPVCVKGSLYWIWSRRKESVVGVFDLKDEIFGEIRLPADWKSLDPFKCSLKAYGESSIAVIVHNRHLRARPRYAESGAYHMRVMDVDDEGRNWEDLTSVSTRSRKSRVLCFKTNGEVIMKNASTRTIAFRQPSYRFRHILWLHHTGPSFAFNYGGSLALFDRQGDLLLPATNFQLDAARRLEGPSNST